MRIRITNHETGESIDLHQREAKHAVDLRSALEPIGLAVQLLPDVAEAPVQRPTLAEAIYQGALAQLQRDAAVLRGEGGRR